jgi:predicted RNase H-like HicB family nuclease
MKDRQNHFEFTGDIFKEGRWFVSLRLDLDVASQGKTVREAKKILSEAVTLYLEGCFESNLPYLRSVPREEDPRFSPAANFVENLSSQSRLQGPRRCLRQRGERGKRTAILVYSCRPVYPFPFLPFVPFEGPCRGLLTAGNNGIKQPHPVVIWRSLAAPC